MDVWPVNAQRHTVKRPTIHYIPTRFQMPLGNIIGELPESNGFNAILVIVDRFSKMIIVIPTNMELTAQGTARIY